MLTAETLQGLLTQAFTHSNLSLSLKQTGKVRDTYLLPNDQRLLITTDRLSAFDHVLGHVPYKGQVLNQLSAWWFAKTADIIPNHVLAIPDPNALLARNTKPLPIEIIVRGYLTGVTSTALWTQYASGGRNLYGYPFPDGMQKNQRLPQPIITPTTKGEAGQHDIPLTSAEILAQNLLAPADWQFIQDKALALFQRGQTLAARAGLLLVDTKYEFGYLPNGEIILIDELHTPDSSRYWLAASYADRFADHQEPENFDKEYIRLAYVNAGYRGNGKPPVLPDALWITASQRYIQTYEMLTGETFVPGAYPVMARLQENLQTFRD